MTTTRELMAQQTEIARREQEEAAGVAAPTAAPATTMHEPGDDPRTHIERINEFDTAKEASDMLSPEQFAELKDLLEPIAEVNILMLPMIRRQAAQFAENQARLGPDDEAAKGADNEAGEKAAEPPPPPAEAPPAPDQTT